ncbi:MAG: SPOR domain-containing protein [Bacteroidota bacterium]
MNFKKTNALLTILIFILFSSVYTIADGQQNPLVKAIQLFDEENYNEAEVIFKKLINEKPDHLMVNYFYGACRTENGHYGTNEIVYLLNGSIGESPMKADYYLGIQYHAKSMWDDALKHYKRHQKKTDITEAEKVNLEEKIQQCYDKINPFETKEATKAEDVMPVPLPKVTEHEEINLIVIDSVDSADSIDISVEDSISTTIEKPKKIIVTDLINFVINSEITYLDTTHFHTKKGLKLFCKGNKYQKELNIQQKEADKLREEYGSTDVWNEKQSLGEKILAAETEIYHKQSEIKSLFIESKQIENEYWQNAPSDEKEAFIIELENCLAVTEEAKSVQEEIIDSSNIIVPGELLVATEITRQNEDDAEDELIYKIQIGAYSRGLPAYVKRLFDKLSYIRKIENYTDENGVVVYTTGNLTNYDDAVKMKKQVRQEGVEDAYIVPYFNGKRITLKEAKEIEKAK